MRLRTLLLTTALACGTLVSSAQKLKVKSGSFDALKGVTQLNAQFDYSNMTVTTKNKGEAEFVENKKEELNKKEAGRGDTWASSWVTDREARFEVQFKEEFDKQSRMTLGDFPGAKYTLIFHTTHTETGYNIGISSRPAYIDGEVKIVETANPSNVIVHLTIDNSPGRQAFGMDFDTGVRLAEAYAKAGKEIGKMIRKKVD